MAADNSATRSFTFSGTDASRAGSMRLGLSIMDLADFIKIYYIEMVRYLYNLKAFWPIIRNISNCGQMKIYLRLNERIDPIWPILK